MDTIFNMFKIRYTKLDELISKNCKELTYGSKVNVFINLEPVFRKLINSDVDNYLKVKTDEKIVELISNIINLIAHYRLFFTKNKLYSRVYIYMGFPFNSIYFNRKIIPEYRKNYQHKFTKDSKSMVLGNIIENSLPLLKIILEYIEGVYFIESGQVEPSLIPLIINEESNKGDVNFLITADRYEYQYVIKDFYILRPKQEDSYLINKNNVIDIMKLEEKIINDKTVDYKLIPFILSILGDKYRNLDKIKRVGLSTIIKLINEAIRNGVITENVDSINMLLNLVKDEYRGKLLSNFYCIDLVTQYNFLGYMDVFNITSQLVDKFDNVSLKKINDKYFTGYPIMLMEICEANKLLKKNKNIFL